MTQSRQAEHVTRRTGDVPAVELRAVSRTYGKRNTAVHALDDVSTRFPEAGWAAVMGPSGSGKSTLLHCAAGLESVSSGEVVLAGTDITQASDRELTALRRDTIGFVFQQFNLIGDRKSTRLNSSHVS